MESVVALVAEWISLGKVFELQELSTLIYDVLREWQDKETMEWLGEKATAQHCENRLGKTKVGPRKRLTRSQMRCGTGEGLNK